MLLLLFNIIIIIIIISLLLLKRVTLQKWILSFPESWVFKQKFLCQVWDISLWIASQEAIRNSQCNKGCCHYFWLLTRKDSTHCRYTTQMSIVELRWKPPQYWLAFTAMEGAMTAAGGEMAATVWSNCELWVSAKILTDSTALTVPIKMLPERWCNSETIVLGVSNYFLIGFESSSAGRNIYQVLWA